MKPVKAIEKEYARALKKIARQAAHIVDVFADGHVISNPAMMMAELNRYAKLIEPWANKTGGKMVASTAKAVERNIKAQSKEIATGLSQYLKTESGQVALDLQREQVKYITSIPVEAGERAQNLAMEAVTSGRRPQEVADEIARTQEVTESRALLIARTESAKANAAIVQSRAQSVGATHYIWRTAGDGDVRPSHAEMEGEVCSYDDPPIVDGEPLNPGETFNCFIGSTPFSSISGIKRIIRANYIGEVITVHAGGVSFTATLNHPILTNRGWIAAGDIKNGDYLIKAFRESDIGAMNEENRSYPTFDEVFSALAFRRESHSGLEFNFYGDIPDGDVEIISSDFALSDNIMPDGLEFSGDFPLPWSNSMIEDIGIMRGNDHIGESFFSGLGNQSDPVGFAHAIHSDDISIAAISPSDSVTIQDFSDSPSTDFILSRTSQLAKSGNIIPDYIGIGQICERIVAERDSLGDGHPDGFKFFAENIGVTSDSSGGIFEHESIVYELLRVSDTFNTDFLGHVYTLETDSGWYGVTQQGIVSKNCRCYAEPIIPD